MAFNRDNYKIINVLKDNKEFVPRIGMVWCWPNKTMNHPSEELSGPYMLYAIKDGHQFLRYCGDYNDNAYYHSKKDGIAELSFKDYDTYGQWGIPKYKPIVVIKRRK